MTTVVEDEGRYWLALCGLWEGPTYWTVGLTRSELADR
jgi:hypothetical protein